MNTHQPHALLVMDTIVAVEKLSKDSGKPVVTILKEIHEEIRMKKFREILLK